MCDPYTRSLRGPGNWSHLIWCLTFNFCLSHYRSKKLSSQLEFMNSKDIHVRRQHLLFLQMIQTSHSVLISPEMCLFCYWRKFSKMEGYDIGGIGVDLMEIPDDNGNIKLKVLGLLRLSLCCWC